MSKNFEFYRKVFIHIGTNFDCCVIIFKSKNKIVNFYFKITEKLDQDEIVFIPSEDIRTKLCSKDDLYRILTVDCKFALILNMNNSALPPPSKVLRTNILFLRQILKGTKKVGSMLKIIDTLNTY